MTKPIDFGDNVFHANGHAMSVSGITPTGVHCTWVDPFGGHQAGTFDADTLTPDPRDAMRAQVEELTAKLAASEHALEEQKTRADNLETDLDIAQDRIGDLELAQRGDEA